MFIESVVRGKEAISRQPSAFGKKARRLLPKADG
jgi:hypothetical protein